MALKRFAPVISEMINLAAQRAAATRIERDARERGDDKTRDAATRLAANYDARIDGLKAQLPPREIKRLPAWV